MLKFLFFALLCTNAVLLAYNQGLLGSFKGEAREPQRVRNQINTDKLVLVAAANANLPKAPAVPVPEEAPKPVAIACIEMGNLDAGDARRFDNLIAPLALGERLSRTEVVSQEITSHMVMIPPHPSKEAADKKAAELQELGVSNYFIMNESTPTKWAISLGVFKSEAAAKTLLAALVKQGVTGAKVAGRSTQTTRQVYRFKDLEPATREKLDAIADRFTELETRPCK